MWQRAANRFSEKPTCQPKNMDNARRRPHITRLCSTPLFILVVF